jgi:hypothetical protein
MIAIDIRPVWRFRSGDDERAFDFQLIAILGELDAAGSSRKPPRRRAFRIATPGT